MPIYKAPQSIFDRNLSLKSIFLAGSIEMDKAIDWQKYCEKELKNDFNVFNPRRDSWDSSWLQVIENKQFREQVDWELSSMEQADIILLFFAAGTQSPISLLEFGLYAKSKKMIVVCEPDFWRKGNIDIVCQRYQITQYDSLATALKNIKNKSTI